MKNFTLSSKIHSPLSTPQMSVLRPGTFIQFTNVSIVRLKKGGIRFELACYPNKVHAWRTGVEKDLSQVLQSETIFTNVKSGVLAKQSELSKAFPSNPSQSTSSSVSTHNKKKSSHSSNKRKGRNKRVLKKSPDSDDYSSSSSSAEDARYGRSSKSTRVKRKKKLQQTGDYEEPDTGHKPLKVIINTILKSGDIQMSAKERKLMLDNIFNDIVTMVANKCHDPITHLPIPTGIIERALKEKLHFKVTLSKPTKAQGLSAIKLLEKEQPIPIVRSSMFLRLNIPLEFNSLCMDRLSSDLKKILKSTTTSTSIITECAISPGKYRSVVDTIQDITSGSGSVEVMTIVQNNAAT